MASGRALTTFYLRILACSVCHKLFFKAMEVEVTPHSDEIPESVIA